MTIIPVSLLFHIARMLIFVWVPIDGILIIFIPCLLSTGDNYPGSTILLRAVSMSSEFQPASDLVRCICRLLFSNQMTALINTLINQVHR